MNVGDAGTLQNSRYVGIATTTSHSHRGFSPVGLRFIKILEPFQRFLFGPDIRKTVETGSQK